MHLLKQASKRSFVDSGRVGSNVSLYSGTSPVDFCGKNRSDVFGTVLDAGDFRLIARCLHEETASVQPRMEVLRFAALLLATSI